MHVSEMTEGRRVRLAKTVDIYPCGIFDAGITGTVVEVSEPDALGEILLHVRLDEHRKELNEWDNKLQVYHGVIEECTPGDFEPID